VEWMVHDLKTLGIEGRLATHEEVLSHMNMSTSACFPWMMKHSMKYEVFMDEEFWVWFWDVYWRSLATDTPVETFTTAFMKQEMLKLEKLRQNIVRFISAVSPEHCYASNLLNMHFNVAFVRNAGRFWNTVGCPLQHGGWFYMKSRLFRHKFCHGFDTRFNDVTSLNPGRLAITKVRLACSPYLSQENRLRMVNLQRAKREGFFVMTDGTVLFKPDGQSSGDSDTIIDNTMWSKLKLDTAFICAFLREHGRAPYHSERVEHFVDNITGDDLDVSFAEHSYDWWDAHAVANITYELFGSHMKIENEEPEEAFGTEFLSQHTVTDRGPPLPFGKGAKMIASLFYGNEEEVSATSSLNRILAFRMLSWPSRESFKYFDDICSRFIAKYDGILAGYKDWDNAKRSHFTEPELRDLWLAKTTTPQVLVV